MRKVKREEILDYVTYGEFRDKFRRKVLKIKEPRRIHLGANLTFLFENTATILYQIQEMIRAERIVKEDAILHEINTYNELLGGEGQLGCVLLIEVSNTIEREQKLNEWLGLQEKVYLTLESGERIYAEWDKRQVSDIKLSSVQYLKFNTKGEIPKRVGVDHPKMINEVVLKPEQTIALTQDLRELFSEEFEKNLK